MFTVKITNTPEPATADGYFSAVDFANRVKLAKGQTVTIEQKGKVIYRRSIGKIWESPAWDETPDSIRFEEENDMGRDLSGKLRKI